MPLRRRADRHALRFGLRTTARGLAVPPVQTQIQDQIRFEIIYDLAINGNCEAIYEVFPPDWLLRSLATLIVVITTVAATNKFLRATLRRPVNSLPTLEVGRNSRRYQCALARRFWRNSTSECPLTTEYVETRPDDDCYAEPSRFIGKIAEDDEPVGRCANDFEILERRQYRRFGAAEGVHYHMMANRRDNTDQGQQTPFCQGWPNRREN